MQNFCAREIGQAGNVGYTKYTIVGEKKKGNINVVTKKDQICKSAFPLDLFTFFCTDVLSAPW